MFFQKRLYKRPDSYYHENQCFRELYLFFFNLFVLEIRGWKKEYRKRLPTAAYYLRIKLITNKFEAVLLML